MFLRPALILALLVSTLAACATDATHEQRVMLKLAGANADLAFTPDILAREAAHAAGLPVAYAAAMGGGWHAFIVTCPSAAACDAAVERLRADPAYAAVERDPRRRARDLP